MYKIVDILKVILIVMEFEELICRKCRFRSKLNIDKYDSI